MLCPPCFVRDLLEEMSQRANTVVIIEDEPEAADALATIIRDWGAEVAIGSDVEVVAQQLGPRLNQVGWIITDFNLGPGPDGVTRVREIAKVVPGAKVLVLSGTLRGVADLAAAKAGYEIMHKPARAEKIVSWLERA